MGGIGQMAGSLVGTAFGGPVGGMVGGMAGGVLEGLFDGKGGDKAGGLGSIGSLLGAAGNGGAGLPGGINPQLASEALKLFGQAQSPQEKMKLLDIALTALGGKPGQMPGGMNGPGNCWPRGSDLGANAGNGAGAPQSAAPQGVGAQQPQGAAPHHRKHHHHHHHHHRADGTGAAPSTAAPGNAAPSTAALNGSTSSGNGGLQVNGNSVDTGRYTISASTEKDGSVKIFDKQTNSYVEAFGDPHLATSDGDKAQFQKNGLSIRLPDGTNVHLKPTPVNDKGVSWLDGAMVEKDGQAVTFSGMHGGDGQVHTSGIQDADSLRSNYLTQGQTVLDASSQDVGDLYFTDAAGHRTTELVSPNEEESLDGKGGALGQVGDGGSTGAPRGSQFGYNPVMLEKMGQALYLAGANVPSPDARGDVVNAMQSALESMIQQAEA